MSSHKIDFAIGGQAVLEGVMIRSPRFITIAVRKPNKEIIVKKEPFNSLSNKIKILKLPVLRGIVNLFEMLVAGMSAINFSVEQALDDGEAGAEPKKAATKLQKIWVAVSFIISIVISLAFAVFLFKFVPLYLTSLLQKIFPLLQKYYIIFNVIDGLIRIAIFILYISILLIFPYFRRIFQYHGAEHKTVFAYEACLPLTIENIKKESPRHPRCGTSFVIIVFIIAILLFTLVPRQNDFWINFLSRLSIIPFIAGIGYEILKWSAKYKESAFVRLLTLPGLATQYITAKEPDSSQIEVAIEAVKSAVELEKTASTSMPG